MLVPCSSTKQPRHVLRCAALCFASSITCSTISASLMASSMEPVLFCVGSIKINPVGLPKLFGTSQPLAFGSQFVNTGKRLQFLFFHQLCKLSVHCSAGTGSASGFASSVGFENPGSYTSLSSKPTEEAKPEAEPVPAE